MTLPLTFNEILKWLPTLCSVVLGRVSPPLHTHTHTLQQQLTKGNSNLAADVDSGVPDLNVSGSVCVCCHFVA